MVYGWIIIVVLAFASIILLLGKGSWMVAGFNTMSQDEKRHYDKKKICRSAGISIIIVDIAAAGLMLILHFCYSEKIILFVTLGFVLILALVCIRGVKNGYDKFKLK